MRTSGAGFTTTCLARVENSTYPGYWPVVELASGQFHNICSVIHHFILDKSYKVCYNANKNGRASQRGRRGRRRLKAPAAVTPGVTYETRADTRVGDTMTTHKLSVWQRQRLVVAAIKENGQ